MKLLNRFTNRHFLESLVAVFAIIILGSYYVFSLYKESQSKYFMEQDDMINQLLVDEKSLENLLNRRFVIIVFDDLNALITNLNLVIDNLIENEKKHQLSDSYGSALAHLKEQLAQKEILIERIKYHKAIETNLVVSLYDLDNEIFQNMSPQNQNIFNTSRVELFNLLYTNDFAKASFVLEPLKKLCSDQSMNEKHYCENFLARQNALLDSLKTKKELYKELSAIDLEKSIKDAEEELHNKLYASETFYSIFGAILWIVIISLLFAILYFYKNLKTATTELLGFRSAVENSRNVVVITDATRNITYVNEAFEEITGYTKEEVLGKNPRFLKSGHNETEFYKELNNALKNEEKWEGRFINQTKDGEYFYEDATITPIKDHNGVLMGYLSIKRDVTDNVKYEQLLQNMNTTLEEKVKIELALKEQKEKQFIEISKMANLGAMIGNIAHQWRQPLSAISTIASKTIVEKELGVLNEHNLIDDMNGIVDRTIYLSDSINTFRNFIKEKKERKELILEDRIDLALKIVNLALQDNAIELINTIDYTKKTKITMVVGELIEVIINIINNAKDILIEKEKLNPWIKIELLHIASDRVKITIEDNGGGVPQDIIGNIFDEYFTTKDESVGTGLGLHMSKKIICESLHGELYVKNSEHGAKFYIELPLAQ